MKQRVQRIFVEPDKISRHLHCSICHEVFDNPTRMGCGHTFCYVCIEEWASMIKLCPLCKKSLRHRKPQKDLIASNLIDEYMSKCSHPNCPWTGIYSTLKKHQRVCENRQRKAFEYDNQEEIVRVSDDDSDIRETVNGNHIKPKKKVKANEQDNNEMPTFPESPNSSQFQLNILEPMKPTNRISQILQNGYIKKQRESQERPQQQPKNNQSPSYQPSSSLNPICYPMLHPPSSHSFPNRSFKSNHTSLNFTHPNYDQPEYFSYLQQPPQPCGNHYLLKKHRLQQQRLQKQKQKQLATPSYKWGRVHPLSSSKSSGAHDNGDANDNSSEMDNPFDDFEEEKGQNKDEEKKEVKAKAARSNQVIVLDSSEESNAHNLSKESGEMSLGMEFFTQPRDRTGETVPIMYPEIQTSKL